MSKSRNKYRLSPERGVVPLPADLAMALVEDLMSRSAPGNSEFFLSRAADQVTEVVERVAGISGTYVRLRLLRAVPGAGHGAAVDVVQQLVIPSGWTLAAVSLDGAA